MPHDLSASEVINLLGLAPHPEGGHYRETFRDLTGTANRSESTAIYFLLAAGERSRWHRIDASEVWHWYGGAPLVLKLWEEGGEVRIIRLGLDLRHGERPQAVATAGIWQMAETLGDWTLVGCTVAPAFQFENFELAPPEWQPPSHLR